MTALLLANLAIIISGMILVGYSSRFVIDKSIRLANILEVSEFVIGFLLLAVAVSLPELSVAVMSVIQGEAGLAIGNLMSASISYLGLLIALGAVFTRIYINKEDFFDLTAILFFTAVIPSILLFAPQFSFFVGVSLLVFFGIFSIRAMTKKRLLESHSRNLQQVKKKAFFDAHFWKTTGFLFGGLAVLLISAYFVVRSASSLASFLALPKAFIGATIITAGTVLPETALTINGLRARRYGLVVGNAIGSLMTHIGLILGIVLVTSAFVINPMTFFALTVFLIGFNALFWIFVMDKKITRTEGIILFLAYLAYMAVLVFNSVIK